ncbi:MAG: cupin domain-containing protein [Clostridiales bacterium]
MADVQYNTANACNTGNAQYWIDTLKLEPHYEGGWYRHIWTSDMVLPQKGLPQPYKGDRGACSLIYYLLQGDEVSCWHKLTSPEVWTWHCGGSLVMLQGGKGHKPEAEKELLLGARPDKGEAFHLVVAEGVWQTTRLKEGSFVLVSCIVAPAFHEDDFFLPPLD